MARAYVTHSDDGMRAFLEVPGERALLYPSVQDLMTVLTEKGIVYGIADKAIAEMVAGKICGQKVPVAFGTPMDPGQAGRLEILVDLSVKGKPRELKDGSVDHRDIRFLINVRKGTQLARRIPPRPGKPGMTVQGRQIVPPVVDDAVLPMGKGTALSPNDENVLIAETDGAVLRTPGGPFEVRTTKIIGGDIDYSTGNVSFTGDLTVEGMVRGGFSVEATGDVLVHGGAENARIKAGNDLKIHGVAVGAGKGVLESGQTMVLRHVEHFTCEAGKEIVVEEDAIHCMLRAGGTLRIGNMLGGTADAGVSIEVESAGSSAEVATVLRIGGVRALQEEKYQHLREIARIAAEMGGLRVAMYELVRDGMDEAGELPAGSVESLREMKKRRVDLIEATHAREAGIHALEQKIQDYPPSYIKARNLFPGTIVKFGSVEKRLDQRVRDAQITVSENGIEIDKLG